MAHNTMAYEELLGLVDFTKPQPLFMLENYFTETFISKADKISFDEVFKDVTIAPFVSPVSEGKPITRGGYTVRDFSPAYIKLDENINLQMISGRAPGQALNSPTNRLSNLERAIVDILEGHRKSIRVRQEWMAWQYAISGGYTVSGDEYPTQILSFGRNAGNTVTLSGGALWSAPTTATPLDDFENWSNISLNAKRGVAVSNIIMRSAQFMQLRKCTQFKEAFTWPQNSGGPLPNISPALANYVVYRGMAGSFAIWTCDTFYYGETGTQQYFLPAGKVIGAPAPGAIRGVQMFGRIQSLKQVREGDGDVDIWHNHYVKDDGDAERIKTHAAPLIGADLVDAFVCATVV